MNCVPGNIRTFEKEIIFRTFDDSIVQTTEADAVGILAFEQKEVIHHVWNQINGYVIHSKDHQLVDEADAECWKLKFIRV